MLMLVVVVLVVAVAGGGHCLVVDLVVVVDCRTHVACAMSKDAARNVLFRGTHYFPCKSGSKCMVYNWVRAQVFSRPGTAGSAASENA